MRISLLYNNNAGEGLSLDRIRNAIERHGHKLVCVVEKHTDVKSVLEEHPEVVVAAGGDGTIALGARLVAHRGIPLAILPLGTANNIAKSVGTTASIDDVIAGWDIARRMPFDLGVADGPWGRRHFVEAVGGGLVPSAIADMHTRSDGDDIPTPAKVEGAVRTFGTVLSRLEPIACTVVVDGDQTTGNFLLVEILNIRSIGPNLVFSADASPSDGLFRVVTAGEEHRDAIARYLQDRLEGSEQPPSLPSQSARRVTLQGATDVHLDDYILSGSPGGMVSIHIEAGALELLA